MYDAHILTHRPPSCSGRPVCVQVLYLSVLSVLAIYTHGAYPRLLGIHFSLTTGWTWGHGAAAASPLLGCWTQHDVLSSNIKYIFSGNHQLNV